MKTLVQHVAQNTDEQIISGCLCCLAGILRRAQLLGLYCDVVNGVDLDRAVERALIINKQVTLKSAARPF